MSHYSGLIKCTNNKFFGNILISNGIISLEEYNSKKDSLVMTNPFPGGYATEDCIRYKKDRARKLFDEGNYDQLMLETFAFLNSMDSNERSNDVLNIVCHGEYDDEKLKLYSCYATNKAYYRSRDSDEIFYFDQETYKFYNSEKEEVSSPVNFDDYDIIRVSYSFD